MFLSSADRRAGEDARRCTFGQFGEISISSIALTDYEIVSQFDNINDSNNVAYIDDGSQTFPINLTTGFYTGAALAAAVKAAVDIAVAPIVSTITFTNDRFTQTSTAGLKWIPNPSGRSDFADMMGLKTDALSVSIAGTLANLVYTDKLFIVSRALTNRAVINDFSSSNLVDGILGVAYINTTTPTTAAMRTTREIHHLKPISTNPNDTITDFDIELLDGAGYEIPDDQKDNFSWNMTIAISR